LDLDFVTSRNTLSQLQQEFDQGNLLMWTHAHNYQREYEKFFQQSKIIFIYRDIKDILTSHYYRPHTQELFSSLEEYLASNGGGDYTTSVNHQSEQPVFEILMEYYQNWFGVYMSRQLLDLDMLLLSFEEIIENYEESVAKISHFLGQEVKLLKDVRLNYQKSQSDINYTTRDFRKGIIGDYVNLLKPELIKEMDEKYNRKLGVYLQKYLKDMSFLPYHSETRKYYSEDSQDWVQLKQKYEVMEMIADFNQTHNLKTDLTRRYEEWELKDNDVRYTHKVFLQKDKVLKFLYPCKLEIEADLFEKMIPALSQEKIFHFLKSYPYLRAQKIVPEVYEIGLYQGIFYMVQERIPEQYHLRDLVYTQETWEYLAKEQLFSQLLYYFFGAVEQGIVLNDLTFHLNNLALVEGDLILLDGDAFIWYEDPDEAKASDGYKLAVEHFYNILKIYLWKKHWK